MKRDYDRLAPWVDEIRRVYPLRELSSRLIIAVMETCNKWPRSFFCIERLASEAIKYNFEEDDPARVRLLDQVSLEADGEPPEAARWFKKNVDYSTDFDPDLLAKLKPMLVAHLEDLEP